MAAGLIVVAFCAILLGHDPLLFWNDDYELSILPVFADVARSWSEGHLPLLSPYSWVCSNLAGEFQYGTFSIFVTLIAALNGWIICWGATDWFGALGAFAWIPWAWWGLERALDQKRT